VGTEARRPAGGCATALADGDPVYDACHRRLCEYAQKHNEGDFAAIYQMVASPVRDMISESELRDLSAFAPIRMPPSVTHGEVPPSPFSGSQDELILMVEQPEIKGDTAIAGLIVATNPSAFEQSAEFGKYRDPEWVRSHSLPTWGAQLKALGISPGECNLVADLEAKIGSPDTSYWPVARKWIVASLAGNGEWKLWPPLFCSRTTSYRVDLRTKEVQYGLRADHPRCWASQSGPGLFPRPGVDAVEYVFWTVAERSPARCPKCGAYVQSAWLYCPFDGTRLATTEMSQGDQ
jgi:hypothetical protein